MSERVTDDELAALEAVMEAAEKPPFTVCPMGMYIFCGEPQEMFSDTGEFDRDAPAGTIQRIRGTGRSAPQDENIEMLAAVANAAPALVAELRDLRAEVERLRGATRVIPRSECTRDPVVLLQYREWVLVNSDAYSYDDDAECLCHEESGKAVTREHIRESEDFQEHWHTERAFFDRDEAEQWAKARSYNYPDGWRTCSVPAEGDLIGLLADRSTYWDGRVYAHPRDRKPRKQAEGGGHE